MNSKSKVVVVIGSRSYKDCPDKLEPHIRKRLRSLPRGTVIRSGAARGADKLSATIGRSMGFTVDEMEAEWTKTGKFDRGAGLKRNTAMLVKKPIPHLVIAWWDGVSTGTLDTLTKALRREIDVEVSNQLRKPMIVKAEDFDEAEIAITKENLVHYFLRTT